MQLDWRQLIDGRPCLRQRRASLSVRYGRQQRDSDENPALRTPPMVARTVRPPQNRDRGAALGRVNSHFRSQTPAGSCPALRRLRSRRWAKRGYLVSLASAFEHPIGAIADREKRKAGRSERAGGL